MQSEQTGEEFSGIVTAFDDAAGLGEITDAQSQHWWFHCVSIADGSRTISIGQPVKFRSGFRVLRAEAVSIRSL